MDILSRAISDAHADARHDTIAYLPQYGAEFQPGYGHIRSAGRVELAL
jgi:hypothetical protein